MSLTIVSEIIINKCKDYYRNYNAMIIIYGERLL
jgi:hypothetical protein